MTAIQLIEAERQRQIDREGYTLAHDDAHVGGEMSMAAAVYADASGAIVRGAKAAELHIKDCEDDDGPIFVGCYTGFDSTIDWPWDDAGLKLSDDPIRNLVKAGALIVAEIERLQRKAATEHLLAQGDSNDE